MVELRLMIRPRVQHADTAYTTCHIQGDRCFTAAGPAVNSLLPAGLRQTDMTVMMMMMMVVGDDELFNVSICSCQKIIERGRQNVNQGFERCSLHPIVLHAVCISSRQSWHRNVVCPSFCLSVRLQRCERDPKGRYLEGYDREQSFHVVSHGVSISHETRKQVFSGAKVRRLYSHVYHSQITEATLLLMRCQAVSMVSNTSNAINML